MGGRRAIQERIKSSAMKSFVVWGMIVTEPEHMKPALIVIDTA
jgi:hypothetical protein